MKLYFAYSSGQFDILYKMGVRKFLGSYLWLAKAPPHLEMLRQKSGEIDYFLDSGAFSAFTLGAKIDLNAYMAYCKENKSVFTKVATLDVIGDWKATKTNTDILHGSGVDALPTFHYGSPIEELRDLLSKNDYIALGGLVPLMKNKKKLIPWLDKCFIEINGHYERTGERMKVHGFGVNTPSVLNRYPFYSCDATSWCASGRFGSVFNYRNMKLMDGDKTGRMSEMHRGKGIAYTMKDMPSRTNILAILQMEREVTRLWEQRGIVYT